jgi:hypothetical protein
VLAAIVAGVFGALHDQLSYTVSPEYFTKFKFRQFGMMNVDLPERVRAAYVGLLASWWMGAFMGVLVGLAGFLHRDESVAVRTLVQSLILSVAVVLAASSVGLLYGYFRTQQINLLTYREWFIPRDVTHLRSFLCAGYMHNAAYLGGALAIPVAWGFHLLVRRQSCD